ncbi:hypothetical protein JW897_06270 [Chromobacterium alkanivorans]|uniref:DUF7946 domain-containing protein n=1 Tax=Chromobacterium alkanivorans TaxID=1071719 RepID=UPI001966E475|nr:hypothetical protein [Chromobacterium alkanivorans]MBN3003340.1 hypothetical protein [Chromobacterium alkanivorans]
MEIVCLPITYDGKSAEEHKMDLFALGGSIQGVARILAVVSHFCVTGGEYAKQFGTHSVKVYAKEAEAKCFELPVLIEFAKQSQIFSGFAGSLLGVIVTYVVTKASGNREEMKLLSERLEQAIQELGNRDQKTVDRLLSTIDRMADSLRPSVRSAVEPVGVECNTLTIGHKAEKNVVVVDKPMRDAILTADEDAQLTGIQDWEVIFTELDKEAQAGKVRIVGDDSGSRIRADVTDPAFVLPNNRYLESLAHGIPIVVKAKAIVKNGEIDRLYVSDAV